MGVKSFQRHGSIPGIHDSTYSHDRLECLYSLSNSRSPYKVDYHISSYSVRGNYSFLNLEIQRSQYIRPKVTVHKGAETIQGRKLFKGGNYMRKYGIRNSENWLFDDVSEILRTKKE